MLYASEMFRAAGVGLVGVEESPDDLPDLVAEILVRSVEVRHRRHLSLGYQTREAALRRLRGRIDLLRTEKQQLMMRGMVACRFDQLTIDTPRNRFVRFALECISRVVQRRDVARRCRSLAITLKALGVSGNAPTRVQMSTDRIGRSDVQDQFMLAAAKLALDLTLPLESAGVNALSLPDREITWVRRLFERAVGGFYDVVLSPLGWNVRRGSTLDWQIEWQTNGIEKVLPTMRTDVVLDHPVLERRIIIDTKFTSILTAGWYRDETLRSAYIYQIYAYLHSQVGRGDILADHASGLLLHPAFGDPIDETVIIQGLSIRFATVDLTASTADIRSQLLRLCEPTVEVIDLR